MFGAKLHEQSAHYLSKPNKCGSGLTKTALLPFILIRSASFLLSLLLVSSFSLDCPYSIRAYPQGCVVGIVVSVAQKHQRQPELPLW